MPDRAASLLARRRRAPADGLQHPTLPFERRDLGLHQHLDVGKPTDAVDQIARHARLEASRRGRAATPSAPGSRGTRPPAPPSCRRRPARPPARRRASPRAATPSSGRSSPRTPRGSRRRGAGTWRRSRSRPPARPPRSPFARTSRNRPRPVAPSQLQARRPRRGSPSRRRTSRLVVGTGHQRHAADAGRKAQVVLDPRRRAGLAAERTTVEHERAEPFRRAVHRGREPRRPGADDRHVVDLRRIDRADQADAARQLVLARIAQHLAARAEHDRQFATARYGTARAASCAHESVSGSSRGADGRCARGIPPAAARRHRRHGRRSRVRRRRFRSGRRGAGSARA